jgi:hypothetical protein
MELVVSLKKCDRVGVFDNKVPSKIFLAKDEVVFPAPWCWLRMALDCVSSVSEESAASIFNVEQ